jgi:hypothetical protein
MNGFAVSAVVVLVLTAVALLLLARKRKRFLEKRVRIEVANEGNVPSRYELRAESPDQLLDFRFSLQDDDLTLGSVSASDGPPQPGIRPSPTGAAPAQHAPGSAAKAGAEAGKVAGRALGFGGALANGLMALGQILPRSARGPVMQLASRLRGGQMAAMRVQRVPTQAARLKTSRPRPQAARTGIPQSPESSEPAWVQTPSVPPGQSLALELQIRTLRIEGGARRAFRVLSRSVEADDASVITKEGVAGFPSSFWAHRWLPYVAIAAVAIALLLVAFGLATSGLVG